MNDPYEHGPGRVLLKVIAFFLIWIGTVYLWQAFKYQYTRGAVLQEAMSEGDISEADYAKLSAENTLVRAMFLEPAAVWEVD